MDSRRPNPPRNKKHGLTPWLIWWLRLFLNVCMYALSLILRIFYISVAPFLLASLSAAVHLLFLARQNLKTVFERCDFLFLFEFWVAQSILYVPSQRRLLVLSDRPALGLQHFSSFATLTCTCSTMFQDLVPFLLPCFPIQKVFHPCRRISWTPWVSRGHSVNSFLSTHPQSNMHAPSVMQLGFVGEGESRSFECTPWTGNRSRNKRCKA